MDVPGQEPSSKRGKMYCMFDSNVESCKWNGLCSLHEKWAINGKIDGLNPFCASCTYKDAREYTFGNITLKGHVMEPSDTLVRDKVLFIPELSQYGVVVKDNDPESYVDLKYAMNRAEKERLVWLALKSGEFDWMDFLKLRKEHTLEYLLLLAEAKAYAERGELVLLPVGKSEEEADGRRAHWAL